MKKTFATFLLFALFVPAAIFAETRMKENVYNESRISANQHKVCRPPFYYDAFDEYHIKHNLGAMEMLFAKALTERLDFYISLRQAKNS